MPLAASLPRTERVIRGDWILRVNSVADLNDQYAVKTVPLPAPVYLDGSGNSNRGLIYTNQDGSPIAQLGYDGALSIAGATIIGEEYFTSLSEMLTVLGEALPYIGAIFFYSSSNVLKAALLSTGDFFVPSITLVDSLTLSKATGTLSAPPPLNVYMPPATVYNVYNSTSYPFIQTINSAGECTSKLNADGSFETVSGVFNGLGDIADTVLGGFKF